MRTAKLKDCPTRNEIVFDKLISELPHAVNPIPTPLWGIIKDYLFSSSFIGQLFHCGATLLPLNKKNIVCLQDKNSRYAIYYNGDSLDENDITKFNNPHLVKELKKLMKIVSKLDRVLNFKEDDYENPVWKLENKLDSFIRINIGHELFWKIRKAREAYYELLRERLNTNKQDKINISIDLYELLKDFDFPVVALMPEMMTHNKYSGYITDKGEDYEGERVLKGVVGSLGVIYALIQHGIGNAHTLNELISMNLHTLTVILFYISSAHKAPLIYNNIFPNGTEDMPVASKKRITPTLLRLVLIGTSFATEIYTQNPITDKMWNFAEHFENGIALDVLMRKEKKFDRTELIIFAGALLALELLQYDKINQFDPNCSLQNAIAAMTVFPLLRIPSLLVNSQTLVECWRRAKQNRYEFIPSFNDAKCRPRNALGFSTSINSQNHDKRFLIVLPLIMSLICLLTDDKWWVAAAKIMLTLVNAGFLAAPGYKWSPKLFTATAKKNDQIIHASPSSAHAHQHPMLSTDLCHRLT